MARKAALPPNPARLIEGLRDTGYNFNTALTDIIDNSVDAKASKIAVQIQMDTDGDIYITVADNGCGMNEDELLEGMTYGATGKEDPKRLGKFGLGLKTASTAFCRRLSVITRNSGDTELVKATWDLDHVVAAGEWELLLDDAEKYETEIFEQTAETSGTLVVWDHVDRLLKNYSVPNGAHARNALNRVIKGFREHTAMIYQRFIDPADDRARNIEITINGESVNAWDPFCEKEEGSTLVAEKTLPIDLSDGTSAEVVMRAFVLPRKEGFSSPDAAKDARVGANNMQGIYIYRENRLIHPADWLGMFTKEPHGSLLRVEFSFDHRLDSAFQVDIKKSRILLDEALYDWAKNEFLPGPRNAANDRYRHGQRNKTEKRSKGAHDSSNRSISEKEEDIKNSTVTIVDADKGDVEVQNKSGTVRLKLNVSASKEPGQVCVEPVANLNDGILWAPALIDKHHAVNINTGHPYYNKVYVPNLKSDVTVQGMDALMWALAEAELGTINETTKTHFEELRFEVSRLLRKLVEDLPEPDLEESEE